MKKDRNDSQYNIHIEKIIDDLRLQLNRIYVTDGHTEEVVRISQKLDRYILLAQQELLNKKQVNRK